MLPRNQLQQALKAALRKNQNRAKRKVSGVAQCILFVLHKSAAWISLCEIQNDYIESHLVLPLISQ